MEVSIVRKGSVESYDVFIDFKKIKYESPYSVVNRIKEVVQREVGVSLFYDLCSISEDFFKTKKRVLTVILDNIEYVKYDDFRGLLLHLNSNSSANIRIIIREDQPNLIKAAIDEREVEYDSLRKLTINGDLIKLFNNGQVAG